MTNLQSQHIIAIGASAGGMEEVNSFFDHTPTDGVSYIIIQHLSPDFKSRMAEMVAKHSKLKVKEAEDKMLVEVNHVYVIPSKKFMTISNSRLQLMDKENTAGPHLTINAFFNSLAAERGEKAIGIILSGLGSDGTEGIAAIKKAGGMVIARDPAMSEYSSMPANAIATGDVDYILEPELMPDVIEYYVKNDGAFLPHALQNKQEEKIMNAIIDIIKHNLPLDFSDYKQTTILRRIKRRAANHNFNKLENYLAFLKSNKDEIEALSKDFLIGVTSFFRDKEAFRHIEKDIIPNIIKQHKKGDDIKIWVPGCATGEEAYSLAILLKEQLNGEHENITVKIFATDLDTAALTYAGKGLYNEVITEYVSPERLEKFFLREENKFKIRPEIRKMVIFAQHDLVKSPAYSNMDLISCRNLLIYITPPLQKKILHMLHFGLKKNGYLFLGSSENAQTIQGLEQVNKEWRIYKNVEKQQLDRFNAFTLPAFINMRKKTDITAPDDNNYNKNNLSESVNEALMSELDYLLVCVDEKNNVVKTYGDTTKYLLQKNFNANLVELLSQPLAVAFNKASREALQLNKKVLIKGIKINSGQSANSVKLSVKPLAIKKEEQKILMVIFSDDTQSPLQTEGEVFDEKNFADSYTKNLQEELITVKDELQSTLEKLDAFNENMQSFNEELLAANEEMQSTNEEMQSVNEELHTINTDYELKNKELSEMNDELNNYFRGNLNGQLHVNNDLLLMKFSPGTVKHINLRDTDIGRPITNISTNIKFETIESDIKEVINKGGVINREIEATDGKWYQMMTVPYIRQADNKTDGAMITFNEITELKKIQLELDVNNKSLMLINADLDNFVYTASHDLLAPLSNIEMSISIMNEIKVADPKLNKFLVVINSSVKKLRELLRELATIGRIESERLEMEPVNIKELIDDIKLSIQDKINLTGAVIISDFEVTHIHFSKKNLRSIIFNLISNAIKFKSAERDPRIVITTRKENGCVLFSVKDNGIGISKDKVDQAFKMYGRLKPDVEGQGLGLYLAKKLVDAAGGNITVQTSPDRGSTFTILFKEETATPDDASLNEKIVLQPSENI